jgi:hypothetical protein
MRGVQAVADRAVEFAVEYLRSREPDSRIHDVQLDPRFQDRGVDLLWESANGDLRAIEVKGDRHDARGTYFFELVSNLEKDTPGCFLYSTADLLLYVFPRLREVHWLPLAATRAWFLERAESFPVKHTRTQTGLKTYTTLGASVPVAEVLAEVTGSQRVKV